MENKYRKIYVEWWKIQKSTIVGLAILGAVVGLLVGGTWLALKNNWFTQEINPETPVGAAQIVSFEGDVRIIRAATRETVLVTKETWLAAGDTIQTQADGRAVIRMVDQSLYTVRPNSTLVIRGNASFFGSDDVRVTLDDGQVNVKTEEQTENGNNIVEMKDSETKLSSQTDASFNTDAKGSEIRVNRGGVETTVDGAKTTVTANEFVALNNGKVSARESLLAPPKPLSPSNMEQIVDVSGDGASISFAWNEGSGVQLNGFYIQVSRSSYFASDAILVDRSGLSDKSFRLGGLPPGTYYWRLRSASRSGQVSDWSEPSKFNIVRSGSNSPLSVADWRSERIGGNVFLVSGKTQPGSQVSSQGKPVFAGSDGSFRLQIATQLSEAEIEISDEHGNRAGFVIQLSTARILRKF